jgi:RNAse (barnase) inhibitor barstar
MARIAPVWMEAFCRMTLVILDTRRITDWNTFHDAFIELFGFPAFYERNMDAWID